MFFEEMGFGGSNDDGLGLDIWYSNWTFQFCGGTVVSVVPYGWFFFSMIVGDFLPVEVLGCNFYFHIRQSDGYLDFPRIHGCTNLSHRIHGTEGIFTYIYG